MKRYIYPKLPAAKINPFFRIGGSGLANCLFVYAKAIVAADKYDAKIITPTWFNFSLGTYIRHQLDKRHYLGQFNSKGEISGLNKLAKLAFLKSTKDEEVFKSSDIPILITEDIYTFFVPLIGHHDLLREYITSHTCKGLLDKVDDFDFNDCVAVHIRLGDFPESRRVPMQWYKDKIMSSGKDKRILLFSDGSDEELQEIMELPRVERVYFGGAIQDIIAISRCSYVIGSDSSFSAWGAFLGQVPCIFYRLQFGQLLEDKSKQIIENS